MKKQLKDYLHFYLGCDIPDGDGDTCKVIGIVDNDVHLIHNYHNQYGTMPIKNAKPILRPLSDMTEEEANYIDDLAKKQLDGTIKPSNTKFVVGIKTNTAEAMRYLLSKHFDLFGLHEAGLCLYQNEKGDLY